MTYGIIEKQRKWNEETGTGRSYTKKYTKTRLSGSEKGPE